MTVIVPRSAFPFTFCGVPWISSAAAGRQTARLRKTARPAKSSTFAFRMLLPLVPSVGYQLQAQDSSR